MAGHDLPAPLSWAATFDPAIVERMAAQIAATMRRLGVHQGLAPVLDVVRDLRWGRVEETLGEDPFLAGLIGAAYVRGLEGGGVVATLKHFAGYSASRAARNLAPVSIGPRELADVILPPFEMALRAGARSVMNAYTDTDGVPAAADAALLTTLLRDELGFEGTVVADYFSVAFLRTLHRVARTDGDAARLALDAGIDVELPSTNVYGEPLLARGRRRARRREAGRPGPVASAAPEVRARVCSTRTGPRRRRGRRPRRCGVAGPGTGACPAVGRAARQRRHLPLAPGRRLAVVGPRADTGEAMLGCYSFPMHVLRALPRAPSSASRSAPCARRSAATTRSPTPSASRSSVAATRTSQPPWPWRADADVCVAVLGDEAGLFGNGTSGEGNDVATLDLPVGRRSCSRRCSGTGTPVVAVLLVGRPYDLADRWTGSPAIVCGFFPGEEGAQAIADVLAGRVNPSGRLPVSFPGPGSTQPSTYLAPTLGRRSEVSVVDPTPLFPFGHGLSYASATWGEVSGADGGTWATDGAVEPRGGAAQ